jgi:hypothetical protein
VKQTAKSERARESERERERERERVRRKKKSVWRLGVPRKAPECNGKGRVGDFRLGLYGRRTHPRGADESDRRRAGESEWKKEGAAKAQRLARFIRVARCAQESRARDRKRGRGGGRERRGS